MSAAPNQRLAGFTSRELRRMRDALYLRVEDNDEDAAEAEECNTLYRECSDEYARRRAVREARRAAEQA